MRKLQDRIKEEQGAVFVEAAISLTIFIFAIVTILSIINICLVQMKIGTALCGAASDISKFSYVYEKSELNEARAENAERATDADELVTNLKEQIGNLDLGGAVNTIHEATEKEDILNSLLALCVREGTDALTSWATGKAADCLIKAHMGCGYDEAGDYLKKLGVVGAGGSETGIDFSDSHFCEVNSGNDDDIILVANYKVHVIQFLKFDVEFEFEQCAATKAWRAEPYQTNAGGTNDNSGSGES